MAITQINNVLIKHGRLMFAVITAIIIVAFVWFFTPGTSGSILFDRNPNSPNAVAGEVFGQKIKNKDITGAMQSMTLVQAMMYNASPNMEMFNISYDQAFIIAAAEAAAKHLGVTVSDDEVVKMIRQCPAFQKDGKFNADAYIAYEKEKLQPEGYNANDLENAVRVQLTVSSLSKILGEPVVAPGELDEFIKTNLEKYEALSITFKTESFKAGVKATDAELKSFYDSNKNLFMVPEQFKAEGILFPYAAYGAKSVPTAKEIKAYYDANKASFRKDGKDQPLAAVTAEIGVLLKKQKMEEAAMAAAVAFREKIYQATSGIAGNKEAYLAEYRKIAGKYPNKINTGWFRTAADKLGAVGQDGKLAEAVIGQSRSNVPVTDPVAGEKGVYVAAVNGYKPSVEAEYKAVVADVKAKFVEQKAVAKAEEAMRNFRVKLLTVKNADVKKVTDLAKGAAIQRYESFSLYPGSDKVPSEVVVLASGTANGGLSEAVAAADGNMAVYVVKRTAPAAAEITTHKATLSMYYNYAKQDAASNSLYEWINKNTKNYMVQQ